MVPPGGRDGAAARKGTGSCHGAHEELGEIRRGGVEGPVGPDGDVLLQAYAAGCEAGQQGAVFGTDGGGGVPDLQVRGSTLQQWRVHEARGREAVDREVRRGSTPGAFSRSVTRWPRELKLAINGYLPSDWPFLQQSQLSCRVLPLPRMGWQESGVWHSRLRMTTGVKWV